MVGVTREVLARDLPVGVEGIALDTRHELQPTHLSLDHHIQIPAEIAQKCIETLGAGVPVTEDHAAVERQFRHLEQAPALPVQAVAIGIPLQRHALEPPRIGVGPAVEAAGELACIAAIRPADLHSPVAAGVEKRANHAILATADEDGILAHVGRHVVAGLGNVGLVAQEQPAARENALELQLVDLRVEEDLAADQPFIELEVALQSLHEPSPVSRADGVRPKNQGEP